LDLIKTTMIKKPPFLQIPSEILIPEMKCSDIKLYGNILCLSNLINGCTASNETLGDLSGVGERQVIRSLNKMEKLGFIRRHYNRVKKIRINIEPLIIITTKKVR
jgi:hypothetical protein